VAKGILVAAAWAACLAAAGCGDPAAAPAGGGAAVPAPVAAAKAAIPPGLMATEAPAGAVGVAAAKAGAKEGATVVLRGKIGGIAQVFLPSHALFTLADLEGITSCDQRGPDDKCPTPWDFCCEPKDAITARTATVEVVGPDGRPLAGTLDGVAGLAPLKVIVVEGVVGPRPDPAVLVVRATRIFVEP
jgi:hypothetical protein